MEQDRRIAALEAECGDLRAAVEALVRRVDKLDASDHAGTRAVTMQLAPLDGSMAEDGTGRGSMQASGALGGLEEGPHHSMELGEPVDFSLAPTNITAVDDDNVIDVLLGQAGGEVYDDDDVRELLGMYSELQAEQMSADDVVTPAGGDDDVQELLAMCSELPTEKVAADDMETTVVQWIPPPRGGRWGAGGLPRLGTADQPTSGASGSKTTRASPNGIRKLPTCGTPRRRRPAAPPSRSCCELPHCLHLQTSVPSRARARCSHGAARPA